MKNMAKRFVPIKELSRHEGKKASVRGWIYRTRKSNKMAFLVVRDSSGVVQCVFDRKIFDKQWDDIDKLLVESSIEVEGTVEKDKRAPDGYEIRASKLNIVHAADVFPITKDKSPEFLLEKRHLWVRSQKMIAIMKIRHTVVGAIHEFFRSRGYYEFNAPIFQPNACEGGSSLFEVKYYDDVTYLSQSWQLYAEAAIFALEKIYNMSPTFRSEKSKTSRHLAEFWMAEMEAAWMGLEEAVQVAKDEIQFIVKEVLKKNRKELEILGRNIKKLEPAAKKKYPTITYTEALKILKEKGNMDVNWGKDLRTIEEEKLMNHFDVPVVVVEYPKEVMAFYKPVKKGANSPGPVALCFDMLAPEGYGELIGGSERDTDIKALIEALKKEGEDPKTYEWYFDTRRFGSVQHSGYGVGVERVILWICGLNNIKDAIPFPRTMLRFRP